MLAGSTRYFMPCSNRKSFYSRTIFLSTSRSIFLLSSSSTLARAMNCALKDSRHRFTHFEHSLTLPLLSCSSIMARQSCSIWLQQSAAIASKRAEPLSCSRKSSDREMTFAGRFFLLSCQLIVSRYSLILMRLISRRSLSWISSRRAFTQPTIIKPSSIWERLFRPKQYFISFSQHLIMPIALLLSPLLLDSFQMIEMHYCFAQLEMFRSANFFPIYLQIISSIIENNHISSLRSTHPSIHNILPFQHSYLQTVSVVRSQKYLSSKGRLMVQYLGCYNTLDQFQHRQYLFTKAMSEKPILFSKVQKKASTNRPAKHEASKNRGKELRVAKDRTEAKTQTIAYSFSLLGERGSIDLPANSSKREIMKAKAEAQFINRNEQIRKRERGDKLKIQKPSIACEKGNSMRTVEIGCKQSSILPQFKSTELEIAGKNIPPSVQEDKGQERSHKHSKALLKADKRITPQCQFASEPSKPKDLGESQEKKFEVRNSPLFRLDNIGRTPNFDTKMIEKGSHEADTSLEKTQVEQKVKQALKRQRKSKKSRSQLKNGKDLSEGKSVDGRNGFKKRVKRE